MKLKPDFKSINFKTFIYFVLFAAVLMLLLWALQVLFLNNFYGIMKSSQTKTVARDLRTSYTTNNDDEFWDDVEDLSRSYDLDVYVINYQAEFPILVRTTQREKNGLDYSETILDMYTGIRESSTGTTQIDNIADFYGEELLNGSGNGASDQVAPDDEGPPVPNKILGYATVLNRADSGVNYENAVILYIFSPLRPVASTQRIMINILIYVTIISLILACIISLYLSTRITRPIRRITKSAEQLAQGKYGVVFKGGNYTEINQLADTLNSASIELEKSDVLQKDLIANVSHDLRTPLTMIKSYAEMIRDISGDNKEKRESHLQVIMDESDRLNTLVEDLLTVSRLQSGKLTIEEGEFSLTEAADSIVQTYSIMEEEEGYNINFVCPANFTVRGDEEKIKQVLTNLINNAVKFSGEDRTVEVSLTKKGRSVRCSVTDHGVGISSEDLDHIWERYYRSSSNMVRSSEGSGLGLSIVKEILTLHKCSFGVDSTLGEGSTFWFEMNVIKTEKRDTADRD